MEFEGLPDGDYIITLKPAKQKRLRTIIQNAAMHLYFTLLAKDLNDAGLDMRRTLEMIPEIEVPWTDHTIKEHIWKPFQLVITEKQSTTELDTKEVGDIYSVLSRSLAQRLGVTTSFPDRHGPNQFH